MKNKMKKVGSVLGTLALVVAVVFTACRKETPPPGGSGPGPVNPNITNNAAVNAVPLNGGSIMGRWSTELYHTEHFLNDTFLMSQTDSVQVGEEVIEFMGAGLFNLYVDTVLFETGTYTTNGNQLHLDLDSGDELDVTYGATNTQMRWREVETGTDTLGVHKSIDNILFVRY